MIPFTLTKLFEDNFSTDAIQDPLNPTNWLQDIDYSPNTVNLNVALNTTPGVSGKVCRIDAASFAASAFAQQYWAGNAPGDGYVQVTVGYLNNDGSDIGTSYRTTAQSLSSGYQLVVIGPTDSAGAGEIQLVNLQSASTIIDIMGLTISQNDVITGVYIGANHYIYQNGVEIGTVSDSSFLTGGVATVGFAEYAANIGSHITDIQALNFQTGSIGSPAPSVYSVPDCRISYCGLVPITNHYPNNSRTVQDTEIYDVETSNNPAIPPVDSRAAGAPVASGTYPQNSRTPGTFGPGE